MIMTLQTGDKLMTLTDVSEMLGILVHMLYRGRHNGDGPPGIEWAGMCGIAQGRRGPAGAPGRQALTQDHGRSSVGPPGLSEKRPRYLVHRLS
jgi:hypothetical protein